MSDKLYSYSTLGGTASRVEPLPDRERGQILGGLARRVHGVFSSRKNRSSVPWRTREEYELFSLLEVTGSVRSFEALRERISYQSNGRLRSHVPAVRITTRHGDAVLDAFSPQGLQDRERLISVLTEVYGDRGVPYRAFSGTELRLRPRMDNVRYILAHRGITVTAGVELAITGVLSEQDNLTIAAIEDVLDGMPGIGGAICAMALDRVLALDLSARTPREMRVSLKGGRE